MMYIEHFVLLAGAYNLGFFYFFYFLYMYRNVKQCNSAPPPKYAIRDTPVKDSKHLINHLRLSNDINI